jgi:hypothetical protein
MRSTVIILLSFLSVNIFAFDINEKNEIIKAKQNLRIFHFKVTDSVDVANIKDDKIIPDRFFDISFEKGLTTFDYVNSDGDSSLEFIEGQTNFIELNYSFKILKNIYIRTGANLMEFDTTSQDDTNGNFYSWNTSYLGIGTGVSWKFISLNKFYTIVDSKIGLSSLLTGEQRINLQPFDLKNQEDFEGIHSYYSLGFSINYKVSNTITIGLRGTQFVNAKKVFDPFPRIFIENVRLKSRNIGLSLIISNL